MRRPAHLPEVSLASVFGAVEQEIVQGLYIPDEAGLDPAWERAFDIELGKRTFPLSAAWIRAIERCTRSAMRALEQLPPGPAVELLQPLLSKLARRAA